MSNIDEKLSIESIDETLDAIKMRDDLKEIQLFLRQNMASERMIDTISFFLEENEQWIDAKIEQALRCGRLIDRSKQTGMPS